MWYILNKWGLITKNIKNITQKIRLVLYVICKCIECIYDYILVGIVYGVLVYYM